MKYEIQRMLVLSTAHLPAVEREKLAAQVRSNGAFTPGPIVDRIGDYGWRVFVDREHDTSGMYQHFPVLNRLIAIAYGLECDWVAIDRDGNQVPDLETFE